MPLSMAISPRSPPPANISASPSVKDVRMIDSTTTLDINPEIFWQPQLQGFDPIKAPVFCFLISNGTKHVLFDLAVRRDWENYSPTTVDLIKSTTRVRTQKNNSEILDAGPSSLGITSSNISAIIWSHHHFDHIGDPSTFPPSTTLVVGPGFKNHHQPAYPTDPNSPLLDSDTANRPVHELDFQTEGLGLRIGRFRAIDYFRDGSFYLLDAPGHAIGHLCALARVRAEPDSFVFMGADACHHAGLLRPNEYLPLPTYPMLFSRGAKEENSLLGLIRRQRPGYNGREPFFKLTMRAFPALVEARETVNKIAELDALENVFVVLAHDRSLLGEIDLFPEAINDWMCNGVKERTRWLFCVK